MQATNLTWIVKLTNIKNLRLYDNFNQTFKPNIGLQRSTTPCNIENCKCSKICLPMPGMSKWGISEVES